jgi:phenylalanyl-tRNA synthetase beta chain
MLADGAAIGYLGEIHPNVKQRYSIGARTVFGQIDLDILEKKAELIKPAKPLPKFPENRRDIAMLVKDEILVYDMESAIKEKGGANLESVTLFDIYKGNQIEEGYKSAAFSVSFRSPDRTLKDEEVNAAMKDILANLESKLGARLRDK